jgi:membrane peptidoglycan carboxypeptidase
MVKLKFMSQADADKLQFPTDFKPNKGDASAAEFGLDKPTGNVVHHVMDELSHQPQPLPNLKEGGYKIITTINKSMQDTAYNVASPGVKTSVLSQQTTGLQAAMVSVKPGTGEVLAYYGGDNGSNFDYAGIYADPVLSDGNYSGGSFPPGSTFKLYTLAAALKENISIDSYWHGPPSMEFPNSGRVKGKGAGPVTNADGNGDSCPPQDNYDCPLWSALQKSMNTVFFGIGDTIGAAKVIDTAKALGIRWMWATVPDGSGGTKSERIDLSQYTGAQVAPKYFGTEVSIGQYPVTVLDQATAIATIAARGVQAPAHFVSKVMKGATTLYQTPIKQTKLFESFGLSQAQLDDEIWAMQKVLSSGGTGGNKDALANGRDAAAKTGTWEYLKTADNSNAWFNGFTPSLATSVWVGRPDKPGPIKWRDSSGTHKMNGADSPGAIWKKFMDTVLKGQPNEKFNGAKHVGDATTGNGHSPAPPTQPAAPPNPNPGDPNNPNPGQTTPPCLQFPFCISPTPTNPGGGGGSPNPRKSK